MPLKAYGFYEFVDGYGFTRKSGFLDFKACTFKNSVVRRNSVARFKQYNVAYGRSSLGISHTLPSRKTFVVAAAIF